MYTFSFFRNDNMYNQSFVLLQLNEQLSYADKTCGVHKPGIYFSFKLFLNTKIKNDFSCLQMIRI